MRTEGWHPRDGSSAVRVTSWGRKLEERAEAIEDAYLRASTKATGELWTLWLAAFSASQRRRSRLSARRARWSAASGKCRPRSLRRSSSAAGTYAPSTSPTRRRSKKLEPRGSNAYLRAAGCMHHQGQLRPHGTRLTKAETRGPTPSFRPPRPGLAIRPARDLPAPSAGRILRRFDP
jgi:hypothetical protein